MKGVKIDAKPAPFLAPAFKSRIADVPTGCELALIEVNDFHLVSLWVSDGGVKRRRGQVSLYSMLASML